MTRSELLKKMLTDTRMRILKLRALAPLVPRIDPRTEDEYELLESILLVEQKRSEGCDSCHDKNSYEIMTELGWTHCPHCGRSLTEGESV